MIERETRRSKIKYAPKNVFIMYQVHFYTWRVSNAFGKPKEEKQVIPCDYILYVFIGVIVFQPFMSELKLQFEEP